MLYIFLISELDIENVAKQTRSNRLPKEYRTAGYQADYRQNRFPVYCENSVGPEAVGLVLFSVFIHPGGEGEAGQVGAHVAGQP